MLFERKAWEAGSLQEGASALLMKARCQASLSDFEAAASTMDRVPLYALQESAAADFLFEKSLYKCLSADLQAASSLLDEGDMLCEGQHSVVCDLAREVLAYAHAAAGRELTFERAAALSFLPVVAYSQVGRTGEGWLRFAGTAASVGIGIVEIAAGNWVSALLLGGIGLYQSWWKGTVSVLDSVDQVNAARLQSAAADAREVFAARISEYLESVLTI